MSHSTTHTHWTKLSKLWLTLLLVVGLLGTSIAAQVEHLNTQTATATGAGATGTPNIATFNIPSGKNRVLFIWATFERDHCSPADDTAGLCTNANITGTGLGDNWPEPRTGIPPATTSNNQITAQVVGPEGTINKQNALVIGGTPSGDTRFINISVSPSGSPAGTAFFSISSFHIVLFESEINTLLGGAASGTVSISLPNVSTPSNAGDDAMLLASVFQNVEQTVTGFVRNATATAQVVTGTPGNFTLAPAAYDAGQAPDEADDGKLVMAANTDTAGFLALASHTALATLSISNADGTYDTPNGNINNEPNGVTGVAYFRNGGATPASLYSLQAAGAAATLVYGGTNASFLLESDNADVGDAPISYGNSSHTLSGIRLGASVDADTALLNSANATGDDTNNTDDEDGVTLPAGFPVGETVTVPISIQNGSGFLNAWFDWNSDGDFGDTGEQMVTNQAVAVGTTNLSVAVPATAVIGPTFARFRVCTNNTALDNCSPPTNTVQSGEVEDYQVTVAPKLILRKTTVGGVGGPFGFALTNTIQTTGTVTTTVAGTPTQVDGDSGTTGTQVFAISSPTTAVTINENSLPSGWSLSGATCINAESATVGSLSGSTYTITGAEIGASTSFTCTFTNATADYGDAPDTGAGTGVGNYQTTAADGGPSHTIVAGLRLGTNIDGDSGSLQNTAADADDATDTPDDEDGVASFPTLTTASGQTYTVAVNVTNTTGSDAYLVGYIDFNRDGDFLDTGEQSSTVTVNASGSQNVSWTTPSGMVAGASYARFRLSSTQSQAESSIGAATSGEVEDYSLSIYASGGGGSKTPGSSCFATDSTFSLMDVIGVTNNSAFGTIISNVDGSTVNISVSSLSSSILIPQSVTNGTHNWYQFGALASHFNPAPGTDDIVAHGNNGIFVYTFSAAVINPIVNILSLGNSSLNVSWSFTDLAGIPIPIAIRSGNAALVKTNSNTVQANEGHGSVQLNGTLAGFRVVTNNANEFWSGLQPALFCLEDYSDTPITGKSYGSASHVMVSPFKLGATITQEISPYDSVNADGDVDDGITLPALTVGQTATISAAVTGTGGYLQGWIDWNGDGDFADSGEQVATNLQDNQAGDTNNTVGTIAFTVNVPATATTSQTYARFRWATTSGLNSTATASNGEVEDYQLLIIGFTVSGSVYADLQPNGILNPGEDWNSGSPVYVNLVQGGSVVQSVLVNPGTGAYSFSAVVPGNYTVVVTNSATATSDVAPTGWLNTDPSSGSLSLSVNSNLNNQNFGLFHGSKVSGRVFYDDGLTAGTANDALQNGGELGVSDAVVSLSDGTNTLTTSTNTSGDYSFWVPYTYGANVTVSHDLLPATGTNISGSSVVPATDYNDPIAQERTFSFSSGQLLDGYNFGLVHSSAFKPDQSGQTTSPGTLTYSHLYRPGTLGAVNFAESGGDFTYEIRLDANCNGLFDTGETWQAAPGMTVDSSWPRETDGSFKTCTVEVRVIVPGGLPANTVDIAQIASTLSWANNTSVTDPKYLTDTTTVLEGGVLQLTKEVRNLTQGGSFAATAQAKPGEILEYRIHYKNLGSKPLFEVELLDPVPAYSDLDLNTYPSSTEVQLFCPDGSTVNLETGAISDVQINLASQCTLSTSAHPNGSGLAEALLPGQGGYFLYRVKVR